MENVHGISVAGGTFPATIWNLFNRASIGNTDPVEFPEPRSEPEWRPFEKAQYANEYSGGYTPYTPSQPEPQPEPQPPTPPPPSPTPPPPAQGPVSTPPGHTPRPGDD
jgi:hypothetical protein